MFKKLIFGLYIATISLLTNAQSITVPEQLQGKTITLIMPYAPGGDTDAIQRFVGEQARKLTGLNFVYVNKAGAGTILGSNEAALRPADGLTLFGGDNSTHVFNPAIGLANYTNPKLLQPVSVFGITPQFVYVADSSPINSIKDLIAYANANPLINYGCSATQACLYQTVIFNSIGANQAAQINYKTVTETVIGVINGDIVMFMAGATAGSAHVQSGKLKPIAVGWSEPLSVYPKARPVSDALSQFRAVNLQMISVPAGTPTAIVEFWNTVYRTLAQLPEVKERFSALSIINTGYTVQQSEQIIARELAHVHKLKVHLK